MAIRITRNEAGNCINFIGSTSPAYWNACLSAQINAEDSTRVDIINDIRTQNDENTQYEFYAVPFTDFADRDGNAFADAQAMVDYITTNANVIGVSEVGTSLTGIDVNFRLDQTSTSVIMDNGSAFGVNTIKAVADADGTIHIHAIGAGVPNGSEDADDHKHFEGLEHTRVSINGTAAAGGLQDVVNALNELFTVGAFESIVIADPFSTMVADVDGVAAGFTLEGNTATDPAGDDIFTNSTSGNYAGLKSTATIDQAGEYFTFDIRGEGQIGFGLVHTQDSFDDGYYTGSSTYANPTTFAISNSAHYGYQFSHWFHPTPNGSWTNYGASTGFIYGPGWSNWESRDEWLAGDPVKMKVGIDENGYIAISSLQDDNTTWILHARSSYPVQEGAVFHLGIKTANASARVYSAPKIHLLAADVSAPTALGDQSITVFEDNVGDITGTLSGGIQFAGTDDNFDNDGFVTTATISDIGDYFQFEWAGGLGDANVGLFSDQDHAVADIQADRTDWGNENFIFFGARTESNGELNNIYYENGGHTALAPSGGDGYGRVGFDAQGRPTLWYSADGTTWTAYRRMNQPAPTGTYRFIWVAQGGGEISSLTTGTMSFAPTMYFRYIESPDGNYDYPLFATEEEANYYDLQNGGTGTSTTATYADDPTSTTWYVPTNGFSDDQASAPSGGTFESNPINWTEITSLTNADLAPPVYTQADISQEEGTAVNLQIAPAGATWTSSVTISPAGSGLVYDGSSLVQGTLADVGADTDYTITVVRANSYGSSTGSMTLTATDVAPVNTMVTPWTKALDFSGNSERAMQVSNNNVVVPMKQTASWTAALPATAGNTSADAGSRPWACAIVFKADGSNSNQHIWNFGEGSGSSDDNIYLRLTSTRQLYFGWGRSGALNECSVGYIGGNIGGWWGVYIGYTGARLSGANATAANLADAFDIRLVQASGGWSVGANIAAVTGNWSSTGGRMDRAIIGDMTIGGRGANRNFHGKVASFVTTTLVQNTPMPSSAEIGEMITDPIDWLDNYKVGNNYRLPSSVGFTPNFALNNGGSSYSTQVWLMGDGTNDSYSNMIRNQVNPSDQNYTKLNLISMVSNDIQTVTIPGLT